VNATRYAHIGYPKNMSTTLQRGFFDAHPQIRHLGIGVGSNVGYIDEEIGAAIELYLQYCRDFRWTDQRARLKAAFERQLRAADEDPQARAVGLSLEHLSFSYTPDNIDVTTKARRLLYLLGPETRIIMVIREQWALLRSLYRECIRQGYPGTFSDFCEYAFKFQDRSFLLDFLYDRMYALYTGLFGEGNVLVLFMDELRAGDGLAWAAPGRSVVSERLAAHLGVSPLGGGLGHFNAALSEAELVVKRELNHSFRHDLGNRQYSSANTHRISGYFTHDLGVSLPQEAFMDVRTKRYLIAQARELAARAPGRRLDYDVVPEVAEGMSALFSESDLRLHDLIGRTPGCPEG